MFCVDVLWFGPNKQKDPFEIEFNHLGKGEYRLYFFISLAKYLKKLLMDFN